MYVYFNQVKKMYPHISDENLKNHIYFGYLRSLLRLLNMKRIKKNEKIALSKALRCFLDNPKNFDKTCNLILNINNEK